MCYDIYTINQQNMKLTRKAIFEFLRESNAIENVYDKKALEDAVRAWDYAYKHKNKPMTEEYVLNIHELLMKRLNPRIAGRFRKCAVMIGYSVKDDYKDLDKKVRGWVKRSLVDSKEQDRKKTIYQRDDITRAAHVAFEDIHPFEDGNGRTGRILYNIHRINLGLPLHIIHEGDEQYLYYQWFRSQEDEDREMKDLVDYFLKKDV